MNATEGRMIKKSISRSDGFAALSPKAAVLFCMTIPHLNSHGKCNGGAGFIKDEICPKIPYLTPKNIPKLFEDISAKTNLKRFIISGLFWLHAVNFLKNHQKLDKDRLGKDSLPSWKEAYSRVAPELPPTTPDLLHPEGKVREDKVRQLRTKTTAPPNRGETETEPTLEEAVKNRDTILRGVTAAIKGMEE